ncbi:ATPase, V1/A1 complex, subunit E [Globomyces pollinis-pini]|nr:ATPase, V1/A1 complex, subunit E [Globomyces pollinis-pini]
MAGRLNDSEVAQEMNKMVAFIKQEALEKARETKIKADEEFNIEKGKLVRAETVAIEAFFQKKLKQADVQRKISASHLINKNRLQVLAQRQQVLNDLFAQTKLQLNSLTKDSGKYQELLKNLLLQGMYRLMEKNVLVKVREQDYNLAESAIKDAVQIFKQASGIDCTIEVDKANPLPKESYGGVVLGTPNWNILCSNTLESRLDLLQENMLPEIRTLLFGPSPSRKFYN